MKTISLVANHTPKMIEKIKSGGGVVSKIENGFVFFDATKTYPDLSPEALKRLEYVKPSNYL